MMKEAILKIAAKQNLTGDEAYAVMNEIMSGETTQVQTSAFLAALSVKGETNEEIAGCAAAMRDHAMPVKPPMPVLEIVGTGGDHSHSINISSAAAIIIAAAGQPVAKHGNRAASSDCGAADVLEALGVSLDQPPEKAVSLLKELGICFFFAQKYHTSMKYVGPIRKELGIRTVFNLLGPLTNPASPAYQVLGVYSETLLEPMAEVLAKLGVTDGLVVFGQDVLDEISMSAPTTVCEFHGNEKTTYTIRPEDFGFARCQKSELEGGAPAKNAAIIRDILSGKERGPKRQAIVLNAGAALYISKKAATLAEGAALAAETIDSGKAARLLEAYIQKSNS